MRAYRFFLSDKKEVNSSSKIILEQNIDAAKNTDNIHIDFDIQRSVNNETKEVFDTATLSLYNINRYWHNENAQEIINSSKVELYAGVKATPIHYHQGIIDQRGTCRALNNSDIILRPIYQGYVKNAYPNMDGVNTILRLNLENESFKEELKGLMQISINHGEKWRPIVKKFLEDMINKQELGLKVELGTSSKESLELTGSRISSVNINGIFRPSSKNGVSLLEFVKKNFNEIIYKEGNVIYIGENKNIKDKPPIVIRDGDLIGQPQMTESKTISFNVPITSKFSMLQKIELELNSFSSINQASNCDLGYNPLNRLNKMFKGQYQIIRIWHKGQSRNQDAESWSTAIEAIKL